MYIPGNKNIVADALSCLPLNKLMNDNPNNGYYCADLLVLSKDNFPPHTHLLNYKTIMQHQQEDKDLLATAQRDKLYVVKDFTAAGRVCKLIYLKDKIGVPKTLQKHVVQWYHVQLCHPGETHTGQTIRQHFTWGKLSKIVKTETTPWDNLCIDLIGPYKILSNNKKLTLWALTMIDPVTWLV